MQELATTATFVDYDALGSSITAVLPRSELEAARDAGEAAQLWFELDGDDLDTRLLTIDLATADLEKLLGQSGSDVYLALDGDGLASILGDADVEAHGLRGALAIAVTTAAIAAPAGLAAAPQTANPANTLQQASPAAMAQVSTAQASTAQASTAQASTAQANPAATAQVSTQVAQAKAKAAAKPQRASAAARAQVAHSLVLKAAGLRLLGKHLAR